MNYRNNEVLTIDPAMGRRWVAALRSGDYRQTKGSLRRMGYPGQDPRVVHHCAVGVLCEIENVRNPELLPMTPALMRYVIRLNDNLGNSFRGIADYVESLLPPEEPEVTVLVGETIPAEGPVPLMLGV